MNRDDIIRIAREAGIDAEKDTLCRNEGWVEPIERFAALVAAAERDSWPAEMEAMERQVNILTDALAQAKAEEREACAKVCESMEYEFKAGHECADAIRARGEAK